MYIWSCHFSRDDNIVTNVTNVSWTFNWLIKGSIWDEKSRTGVANTKKSQTWLFEIALFRRLSHSCAIQNGTFYRSLYFVNICYQRPIYVLYAFISRVCVFLFYFIITRCTELHVIRERPYGVGEPRLLVVSSKLLFLRWCSLWENRQTSSVLNEREAGFNEQNVSRFAIVPKRFYGRSKQSCRKIRRTENIAQHSLTSLSRA